LLTSLVEADTMRIPLERTGMAHAFEVIRRALLSAALMAPALSAEAAPEGYASMSEVALRHGLRLTRNASAGVVIGEGGGLRVTAGPGMSVVLLNGVSLPLDRPVVEEDGDIHVPDEVTRAIAARAGSAPTSASPAVASPPAAVEPARAAVPVRRPAAGPVRALPRPFTVVVDAGHGGEHTGGKGKKGLMEKTVNLDVALRLEERLTAAGVRVIMTRTRDAAFSSDRNEDLRRRFEISNRAWPDLFLSIHSNWAESDDARGFEIYVRRERPSDRREKLSEAGGFAIPAEPAGGIPLRDAVEQQILADLQIDRSAEGSRRLAREIEARFRRSLATENRGLKEQDFQVIRWSNAPAALVELEFISNPRGERELGSPAHRGKLAQLLAEAVLAFRDEWGD
jgi:N-acetylmuramoyl-L-alanine amidase